MNQVMVPTSQSFDPSQEDVLNQNNETIPSYQLVHQPNQFFPTLPQVDAPPAINQEFYANTSEPDPQYIPAPTFATIPVHDPLFCAITPSPSENIPNLYHAHAPPAHVQSFTTLEPAQNIPTSTIPDYQNIPALVSDTHQYIPTLEQNVSVLASAPDMDIPTLDDHGIPSLGFDQGFGLGVPDHGILSNPIILTTDMLETANNAMEELTKLLNVNEPFWFRSLIDGKFILQRETYQKMYPKYNSLNRPHAYVESSKDLRIVNMSGTQLVDMFLNAVSISNPSYFISLSC